MKFKTIRNIFVFLLFLGLILIFGATLFVSKGGLLEQWEWVIYACTFVVFVSSVFIIFFAQKSSESLKLDCREREIDEAEEELQQARKEYQAKFELLAQRENEVKQKLLQYQQYIEFPDEQQWHNQENNDIFDAEIAQLLHDKAKVVFDNIASKKYIENNSFKHELLLEEFVDLIESVARIHHPDSQNPILETSVENLLRSLNRLSMQLLVYIDSSPINIKEYNLRTTYSYIQQSVTVYGYYKKAEPFLSFAAPVLRIGMAANPVIGIAQTVAIEAGKQVAKKGSEKYALNLLHDVIEIIGEQATTIFGDESFRYRCKHWIYAVELTEIICYFAPVQQGTLAKALKIVTALSMRSEYDRIFIYHCMAQGKSAGPDRFKHDFFSQEDKQEIVNKLSDFVENTVFKDENEQAEKRLIAWREKIESRFGIEIQLNIDKSDSDYLRTTLWSSSPEKKIKPFLARYILKIMDKAETPQFIYTDIYFAESLKAEASIRALEDCRLWLIGSNQRFILLAVNKKDEVFLVWEYSEGQKEQLSLERVSRVVADDCRMSGGVWLEMVDTKKAPEFIIEGRNIGSYDNYFQVLNGFKRILS
ncbi:MAG: hypothetical protein DRQ62_04385 [Gammaproteobacteria bacterium]|nr:MAG: hypothetical protein DRQ62_04385 [Gammaproteobacteria bacterium]